MGISLRVSKTFPEPVGKVLDRFELALEAGEIVALVGPSGCGKSTLLSVLAGILPADLGSSFELPDPYSFSFAFQKPELIPWRSTLRNAHFEAEVLGTYDEPTQKRVASLLKIVGLDAYPSLFPEQLSLGMQQRLQLVRAGNRQVQLVLADEPLGAVDHPLRIAIAQRFREHLGALNTSALWVTHDTSEAVIVADRVLVLGGRPMAILKEHRVRRDQRGTPLQEIQLSPLDVEAIVIREKLKEEYELHGGSRPMDDSAVKSDSILPGRPRGGLKALAFSGLPMVLFLLSWEALGVFVPDLRFFISRPSEWLPLVYVEFATRDMLGHVLVTVQETLVGFAIGAAAGVAVGFWISLSKPVASAVRPYLIGMTAVPLFVLAPAFILWFGVGLGMKIAIAALSCFPLVAYSVLDAAVSSKGALYHCLLRSGASKSNLFVRLILPASAEGILANLRAAAVTALIGAFLGEFIASSSGLGYYILFQASRYRIAEVFVGVSVLFALAVGMDSITRLVSNRRVSIISYFNL